MTLYYQAAAFALIISAIVLIEGIIYSFGAMFALIPAFTTICAGLLLPIYSLYLLPTLFNNLILSGLAAILSGWFAAFIATYMAVGPPSDGLEGVEYAKICVRAFLLGLAVVALPLWWTIEGLRWIQMEYYTPTEREVWEYMMN